ncbi:MAG: transporter substrate-binding domain-containing protein [Oscillospiraceae bacterium]|jgi:polar amino acid transport system substrate-binding protein|nr:transporter substrate-binding domain-containing protein [Oscillospiraceae bacterium]
MKKISLIYISLAMCVLLTILFSIYKNNIKKDKTIINNGKIYSGKTFKVATNAGYRPFENIELDENGEKNYIGFDIDLLKQISEVLGFKYEIIDMDFNGLIGSLNSKRADLVIAAMNYTEERAKSVDFSDPYYYSKIAIVYPEKNPIKTISEIKDKKISVMFGTVQEEYAYKFGAEVTSLNDETLVSLELFNKKVDAFMTDDSTVPASLEKHPGYKVTVFSNKELGNIKPSTMNIAFPKGSSLVSEFNKCINQFQTDGTINKLIEKWLGKDFVVKDS